MTHRNPVDPNWMILHQVKSASKACEGLCTWVLAMEVYERVIKVVKPKQAKLAEAEAELAIQMEKLTAKQAELKEVEDALKVLNDQVNTFLKIRQIYFSR